MKHIRALDTSLSEISNKLFHLRQGIHKSNPIFIILYYVFLKGTMSFNDKKWSLNFRIPKILFEIDIKQVVLGDKWDIYGDIKDNNDDW